MAAAPGTKPWSLASAGSPNRALNAAVNRLANALSAAGYQRGDALTLACGNSIEFLLTYYACAKTGAVCVPINLAWGRRQGIAGHRCLGHQVVTVSRVSWTRCSAAKSASWARPEFHRWLPGA